MFDTYVVVDIVNWLMMKIAFILFVYLSFWFEEWKSRLSSLYLTIKKIYA